MKFVTINGKSINADKIIYITDVEHTWDTFEQPALFYYRIKLEEDITVQAGTFPTEQEAKLHRAQLINKLENK